MIHIYEGLRVQIDQQKDVKVFFDNMDHELVLSALRKHTDSKWIIMYIDRWLKAPAKLDNGTIIHAQLGLRKVGS